MDRQEETEIHVHKLICISGFSGVLNCVTLEFQAKFIIDSILFIHSFIHSFILVNLIK